MTLPASGQISLLDIANEHGGPTSNIALSNYYRGSGTKFVHANNTNIPASGTISESNFLGTSRFGYYWVNSAMYYNGNGNQFGWSSSPTTPFGSIDYNNKYRGQLLGWIIWNEYDHVFGVSMNGANIPRGYSVSCGPQQPVGLPPLNMLQTSWGSPYGTGCGTVQTLSQPVKRLNVFCCKS